MLRVLLVDDYEPWRVFVASMLQNQTELGIVGEATDGLEAVQIAQQAQPDLILLDIGLPKLNGLEAAQRIRKASPQSKIVIVSENRSRDIAEAAFRNGAGGYVVKSSAARELLPAIAAVLQGKQFISAHLAGPAFSADHKQSEALHRQSGKHHDIRFYNDDSSLVDDFVSLLKPSAKTGNAVIVIATETHRTDIFHRLQEDGFDTAVPAQQKRFIALDVADSSPSFIQKVVKEATGKGLHIAVG